MELKKLIDAYGETKTESDKLKKEVESYNSSIKSLMNDENLSYFNSDKYYVKLATIEQRVFDEQKLLDKLKEMGATNCIKTIEVVDMNELENAIYNKQVDASKLSDCQVVKSQQRLTLGKVKEKKDE